MELWLQLINAETEEELDLLNNTQNREIQKAVTVIRGIPVLNRHLSMI